MNLYNYKNYFWVVAACSMLGTACKDSYLEVRPTGLDNEASFFAKQGRQQEVLNSAYRSLGDDNFLGKNVPIVNETWSDNVIVVNPTQRPYFNHILGQVFNDEFNGSLLDGMGNVCRDANYAIYGVEKFGDNVSASDKTRIIAEAKFVRAIAHFETVRLFAQPWGFTADNSHAGIGLRQRWEELQVSRSSVSETYNMIIQDLKDAEANLTGSGTVYATKAAAQAYLAKVYFQQNRYQEAYNAANSALAGVQPDSLKYRFSTSAPYTGSIFQLTSNLVTGQGLRSYNIANEYLTAVIQPNIQIDPVFAASIPAADARRKAWIVDDVITTGTIYRLTKFPVSGQFNMNVLHWAEITLLRAEAAAELNQIGNALADLNAVRGRAGYTPLTLTSAADIIRAVRTERRIELMGEGNRTQDIKRIGAASARGVTQVADANINVRNAPWNCPGFVVQFPSKELAGNPNFFGNPQGRCN